MRRDGGRAEDGGASGSGARPPAAASFASAQPAEAEEIRAFLCAVGWGHRLGDAAMFARLLAHSDRTVVARAAGRVVGFARALCDGESNGYVSMVAVAPELRGRGIGRELIERLIGDDPRITWVLRAGPGSPDFWRRLGFVPSQIAMERVRSAPR